VIQKLGLGVEVVRGYHFIGLPEMTVDKGYFRTLYKKIIEDVLPLIGPVTVEIAVGEQRSRLDDRYADS
jgi:hypothetical protein